jgi:hypothetical protein
MFVGFHRSYRRLLEGIRLTNIPQEQERLLRSAIKQSIRFPSTAHEHLSRPEVSSFLIQNGEHILKQSGMPSFFKTFADLMSQPIAFGGSILDVLKKYSNDDSKK